MRLPDRSQGLTPTENVGGGLILRTALPAQWAVCQPHQMEVPAQGIVPGKKSGVHPGLSPSKGQKPNPGAPTGPGDQLSSLSLGAPKIPPSLRSKGIVKLHGVLFYGVLGAGNGTGLHNPQRAIPVNKHDVFIRF
jgi:hypothetical protein